jgi:hypothetical protein
MTPLPTELQAVDRPLLIGVQPTAPHILYSFVHWNGIWMLDFAVVAQQHPPLRIQFFGLLCQHPVVMSCPCCSPVRSQRLTYTGPRLIFRACPEHPGTILVTGTTSVLLVLLPCAEPAPCCSQVRSLFPAVGNSPSPAGARSEGCFCLRFLIMELTELI